MSGDGCLTAQKQKQQHTSHVSGEGVAPPPKNVGVKKTKGAKGGCRASAFVLRLLLSVAHHFISTLY